MSGIKAQGPSQAGFLGVTYMEQHPKPEDARNTSTALRLACLSGGLPLLVGSTAFAWWWISRSDVPILLGIGTVMVGPLLVLVATVCLVIALRKRPRVSRTKILATAVLVFSNFPIAWGYWEAVFAEVSTSRYQFVNESGGSIDHLSLRHRERQIGSCERLDDGESIEFLFSALDNGGEGPISFSAEQDGQMIGGETGVMAFVFTKSHVDIVLLPNGKYRVRVQGFSDGRPAGTVQETDWGSSQTC